MLSGGQRQRLAIARALANEPTLLLADEPTGALDSEGGHEVLELFRRLHANGQTILLVTHDREVADAGDRIVFMRDGRIESEQARGLADAARATPVTPGHGHLGLDPRCAGSHDDPHRHPARAHEPARRRPPPARYRPSGSTLPTRLAALLAIAAAALAAGDANSASVGPGRFVLLIVVIAWCVGALVTSVFRPAEPLAALDDPHRRDHRARDARRRPRPRTTPPTT